MGCSNGAFNENKGYKSVDNRGKNLYSNICIKAGRSKKKSKVPRKKDRRAYIKINEEKSKKKSKEQRIKNISKKT